MPLPASAGCGKCLAGGFASMVTSPSPLLSASNLLVPPFDRDTWVAFMAQLTLIIRANLPT